MEEDDLQKSDSSHTVSSESAADTPTTTLPELERMRSDSAISVVELVEKQEMRTRPGANNVNPLSRLTFWWITSLVWVARKRILQVGETAGRVYLRLGLCTLCECECVHCT
jgi:hypothetical protein